MGRLLVVPIQVHTDHKHVPLRSVAGVVRIRLLRVAVLVPRVHAHGDGL